MIVPNCGTAKPIETQTQRPGEKFRFSRCNCKITLPSGLYDFSVQGRIPFSQVLRHVGNKQWYNKTFRTECCFKWKIFMELAETPPYNYT